MLIYIYDKLLGRMVVYKVVMHDDEDLHRGLTPFSSPPHRPCCVLPALTLFRMASASSVRLTLERSFSALLDILLVPS